MTTKNEVVELLKEHILQVPYEIIVNIVIQKSKTLHDYIDTDIILQNACKQIERYKLPYRDYPQELVMARQKLYDLFEEGRSKRQNYL